ncbi:MAG TPA: nitrate- and nitrite sensing domain-containing protein [Iamia sp.]
MFDRLSIRTKLIAIVAAPLAVIIGLAGLGYTQRSEEATGTRADAVRLEAIVATQALQGAMQLEALYSVAYLAGPADASTETLEAQQAKVDEAAAVLRKAVAAVGDESTVQSAGASAQRAVDQLDISLRRQVMERALDWTWVENLYRNALNALPTVSDRLVASIDDGELADGASTVVSLGEYTTSQARIGVILAGAAPGGAFPDVDVDATEEAAEATGISTRGVFEEAAERAEIELAVVSSQAGSKVRASLRNRMVGGDLSYFSETVTRILDLPADAEVAIDPERWTTAVEATLEQLRSIADAEATTVLTAADDRVTAADNAARLFLGGALIAVLAALVLAISVATSIARPVMNLTAAADRVASEQLPKLVDALRNPSDAESEQMRPDMEEIDVRGGRELAKLSHSVSQIQEVAVSVATEQATMLRKGIGDMFINLARRNQGLLDRQLEFIDELEAQEEDPDQLEHLFKLDHMATRMRRNAESLLVLAGAEPGRRRGKPVPLTKVALAAVGEIEHFARVDLLDVDECEVVSSAAADLAHLLSELMENATQFSPPDSRVEVVGHGNNGGGYTISITDQGIGMSADQLADANALLTRPPLLGLTLARTLGFIVVGRLAARHGISVRLVPSPAGGVTSIVTIPTTVLVPQLDTLDLSDPAEGGFGGPAPSETISSPSSILPPFEFYTGAMDDDVAPSGADEPAPFEPEPFEPIGFEATAFEAPVDPPVDTPVDAPATLAEAVPTGAAFDDALNAVQDAPEPLIGATPAPAAAEARADETGVARSSPLFGPPPAPQRRPVTPTVDGSPATLTPNGDGTAPAAPRLFGSGSRPPAAPPAPTAAGGTHLFRPPPAPAMPATEARATPPTAPVPPAPPAPPQLPPAQTYVPTGRAPDGPPTRPLPIRTPGPPPGDLLAPSPLPSRAPAPPPAPSAPTPPPAPAAPLPGEPPVPTGPRPTSAPALPTRTPAPTPATPIAPVAPSAAPAPAAVSGNGSTPEDNGSGPVATEAAAEVTSSGLVKRVPRRAGANRAVPGADGPARAPATTSGRSPDEVRAMLSRFHSGKQAGKSPTASPDAPPFDIKEP